MEIARLLTHDVDSDAEAPVRPRPAAQAKRSKLEKLRDQAKALEWIAANSQALFAGPEESEEDTDAAKSCDVIITRRNLLKWQASQDQLAQELRKRKEYVDQLRQYQQSAAAIRKLMRGMELDDWYWKCERWRGITAEYYKPFSQAECRQLVQTAMNVITAYKMPKEIRGDKPSAFGWRDLRGLGGAQRHVHFRSQKTVCGVDLEHTVVMGWSVYEDAALFQECILGERSQLHFQVLQREKLRLHTVQGMAEEVLILQVVSTHPGLVHSLFLVFLVKTMTGYMLGVRCVESPDLQRAMRGEGMDDEYTFYWTRWDVMARDETTGVSTEFIANVTGIIGSTSPGFAQKWVTEGLIALVRFDRRLYGINPLVSLPPSVAT